MKWVGLYLRHTALLREESDPSHSVHPRLKMTLQITYNSSRAFNLHDPEQWVKKVFLEFYSSQGGTGENMIVLELHYLPFVQVMKMWLYYDCYYCTTGGEDSLHTLLKMLVEAALPAQTPLLMFDSSRLKIEAFELFIVLGRWVVFSVVCVNWSLAASFLGMAKTIRSAVQKWCWF